MRFPFFLNVFASCFDLRFEDISISHLRSWKVGQTYKELGERQLATDRTNLVQPDDHPLAL